LDIDCGPTKPYATKKEGFEALLAFCKTTHLPRPAVVISGNGLYAHWYLDRDLTGLQRKASAQLLKGLSETCGFHTDPSRTADSSSVLRPIGSTHRKDPDNPKTVILYVDADPVDFDAFLEILKKAATKHKIKTDRTKPPKLNQDAAIEYTNRPADARIIKSRCQMVNYIAENQALVGEPLWYALVGLLLHCTDGPDWIHRWSEDHPGYDVDKTDEKIEQRRSKGLGPNDLPPLRHDLPPRLSGLPVQGQDHVADPAGAGYRSKGTDGRGGGGPCSDARWLSSSGRRACKGTRRRVAILL
jgi:hypothetical protein